MAHFCRVSRAQSSLRDNGGTNSAPRKRVHHESGRTGARQSEIAWLTGGNAATMMENDMNGPASTATTGVATSNGHPSKKSRTANATKARMKKYDTCIRAIVKPLKEGRALGFVSTAAIAEWLNAKGVPAPNEIIWTKTSVIRALRRLIALGLEPKPAWTPPMKPFVLDLTKPAHYKIYLEEVAKAVKSKAAKAAAGPEQ